ncbi:putative leucine-rich repeat receptor-like protein kinase [Acorus calamus]|uniref:Leucine-rich repeat receptor-like protein kinase n=1 Tax=Acorus calamus TaxID=4465 RepID=A0AAV9DD70_ACOCL|nr:putative leucine-rich repeat receptor-like protein kinase [Acorus calamus]
MADTKRKKKHIPFIAFAFYLFPVLLEASTDFNTLLAFKNATDASGRLSSSWDPSSPDPCSAWYGVSCLPSSAAASPRRVSRLVLEGLGLSGGTSALQTLTSLDQLRVLSLKNNLLHGPLPDLSPLTALKLLFLSNNSFSGGFPSSVASLRRLYRLDLSSNRLSGPIPSAAVNRLAPHLLTLRLDRNLFDGPISSLSLPNLQDLNLSSNPNLTGPVPVSLSAFPDSSFSGNPSLCGAPLDRPCKPSLSPASASAAIPMVSSSPDNTTVITSASDPTQDAEVATDGEREGGRMSRAAVVAIVVGDVVVLAAVCAVLFCYFWRKFSGRGKAGGGGSSRLLEGEKIVYSASPYGHTGLGGGGVGFERGRMFFFEGERRFEVEELLRASAEMLGKGGFGTAYKAVLDDGTAVAVKRLRDVSSGGGSGGGKRDFEALMDFIGGLRHPNLVTLKAYYFARDEKLLVYDYMPNGSLFSHLHGNRGPGRTPLDWTTRVRIVAGAARGLAHIHRAGKSPRIAHGNVKSTNVLIDKSGEARVSDFGLSSLLPSAVGSQLRSNGYRAPEMSSDGRKATQKADVYAFGVLLLEVLTGKCPSGTVDAYTGGAAGATVVDLPRWVQSVVREEWTAEVFDLELMRYKGIEEEMVSMLQIALACASVSPDQRPKMSHVVRMIDEIRGEQMSPSHESFDSVSDSPSNVSEDASGRS